MGDLGLSRVSLAGTGALLGRATTAAADGACLAAVSGISVTARVVAGLVVAAGDTVLIQRVGATYWVAAVATAAPTVPPAPPDPEDAPPADTGDDAPPPKPVVTTGSLVCHPVATSTYRDGSWRTDIGSSTSADTYQGRYAGSSFGRNSGFAFYGSKPASLSGATVTKATVRLRRLSSGDYAGRAPTLRLVTEKTRPSGSPTLHESLTGPSLTVGGETTFTLPDSWGQHLVDGDRGGIGIVGASDSPYIRLAGRDAWSAAWTLTLYWRRSS
jgi:hypothetical protein